MTEKTNELIINVREYLLENEKQTTESLKSIQNQIDSKNLQIRDIFANNLEQVISHYMVYQEVVSHQKKIQNLCEDFSKRIEKTQSLSLYDEKLIERGETAINSLKDKRKELMDYKDSIVKLKKIVMNISQDRFNNAIKILVSYQESQPKIDTPLKRSIPIIMEKIHQHMIKLVTHFWELNDAKMLDIGSLCFNKIEMTTHQKTNIYQAFFGRNSAANRNSLIRKSSIVSSVIDDERAKCEAPMRFMKKIKECQVIQRYILRINVQMNNLKQMKLMCKQLNQEETFGEIVNKQNRKMILKIMKENPCENETDLKKLLSYYIGFLLYRREIVAYFRFETQNNFVFSQVYECIGQQAKSILNQPENLFQVLKIKENIDLFQKVLEIVDLDQKKNNYSKVLGDIFAIYCKFSLEQYEAIIAQQIIQDNLTLYVSDDKAEQKDLEKILFAQPKTGSGNYEFTSFVIYVIQIFNQYYDRMIAFVKDSELNKSQLHQNLSILFERIITIYGGSLVLKDQTLQIAQGQINLDYCQKAFKYFSEELQNRHEYIRTCQLTYKQKLDTLVVQLRRCMRQIVEGKIQVMMNSYESNAVWLSEQLNSEPHDFLQWMLEFIKENINFMRESGSKTHEEMIYSWMGYICRLYWDYFDQCHQFTLVTIYNLQVDLLYIYKYINNYFNIYPNLADKFKSISEFYSLMLTSNLSDLLDRQKREISFPRIDLHQLIPIMKKYNKAKNNGGGRFRDLRKKDVQSIVKKLQADFK